MGRRRPDATTVILVVAVVGSFVLTRFQSRDVRVDVVGSGSAIAMLTETDALYGARLSISHVARESLPATVSRARRTIGRWPRVLVVAFDESAWRDSGSDVTAALERLVREANNATTALVILVPSATAMAPARATLAEGVCAGRGFHLCVELPPQSAGPEATRRVVMDAISDGLERHRAIRASTQPSRP